MEIGSVFSGYSKFGRSVIKQANEIGVEIWHWISATDLQSEGGDPFSSDLILFSQVYQCFEFEQDLCYPSYHSFKNARTFIQKFLLQILKRY